MKRNTQLILLKILKNVNGNVFNTACGDFSIFFHYFPVLCNISGVCCRILGNIEIDGDISTKRVVGGYIWLAEKHPEMLFQVLKICNSIFIKISRNFKAPFLKALFSSHLLMVASEYSKFKYWNFT